MDWLFGTLREPYERKAGHAKSSWFTIIIHFFQSFIGCSVFPKWPTFWAVEGWSDLSAWPICDL
jgi:hypothetical protein